MDLIEDQTNLSVRHNDIFLPGRSIENAFAKYCSCLTIWSDMDAYPVYLPGSATLLRYKERCYLVCTRHQLRGSLKENVSIMLHEDGCTKCITSAGAAWWSDELNAGDHNEIAVFDFTQPCADIPALRPLFLDFRGQHSNAPVDQIVGIIVYGYPTDGKDYDPDGRSIALRKRAVLCHYRAEGADEAVHVVDPAQPLDFDPDGMSGGPGFCLMHNEHGFTIHLAGIIVRASRGRLRLIKAGAIQMMLDGMLKRRMVAGN